MTSVPHDIINLYKLSSVDIHKLSKKITQKQNKVLIILKGVMPGKLNFCLV